jgi:hypothetical protein
MLVRRMSTRSAVLKARLGRRARGPTYAKIMNDNAVAKMICSVAFEY